MTTPKCTRPPWCQANAGALAVAASRTALNVKTALILFMIALPFSCNCHMLTKAPGRRGNELSQIVTCATRADPQMNARRTERTTGFSIDLGPGALHDFGPLRRIPADHFRELLGSAARRLVPDFAEPRLKHGRDDRLVDRGIQLVDNGPRHSRGSDHAAPGARVVARDSRLGDRRQVWKARRAPRAAHGERPDLDRARVRG